MHTRSLFLLLTAAIVLSSCAPKSPSVAPAVTSEASTASTATRKAAAAAENRIARDKRRNADVHAMAEKLADDPALLAQQTEACSVAPATNEPADLVVPCRAQAEAHEILAQRAQQSSGGVKNTGSL